MAENEDRAVGWLSEWFGWHALAHFTAWTAFGVVLITLDGGWWAWVVLVLVSIARLADNMAGRAAERARVIRHG